MSSSCVRWGALVDRMMHSEHYAVLREFRSEKLAHVAQASFEQTDVDDAKWAHFVPAVHRLLRPTADFTIGDRVFPIRIDKNTLYVATEVDEVGDVRSAVFGTYGTHWLAKESFPSLESLCDVSVG